MKKQILTNELTYITCNCSLPNDHKILETTLLPTVGSIVQDSATTGHPQALNQRLLPVLLSLSIPFSQENERQNLEKMECENASHLPHHLLNRRTLDGEPHAHTPCVYMQLDF